MKAIYKYTAFLFSALIMFVACTDDAEIQEIQNEYYDESKFVTLNLGFKSQNDKEVVVTRSAATTAEKKLYDLHFYVFGANGKLTGYEQILPEDEDDVIEEAIQTESVSIRTKSGESYIFAVANINKSTTYYLSSDDLNLLNIDKGTTDEEYERNIELSTLTMEKFLNIQFHRDYGDENNVFSPNPAGDVFVMSGYVNDGKSVIIPNGTNGVSTLPQGQNIVKLYRILAKNTFTITSGTTKGTFTPKSFRLCNVPTGGVLMPKAGIGSATTYLVDNKTEAGVESSYRWNFNGIEEITFYLPENLQTATKNAAIEEWKDREKNTWSGTTKTFTNASENAAYIEIQGDFKDKSGSVTANVSYTVHFGDFSSSSKLSDFNVIRNYAYKYKVTVDGVEDIKVEAQTTTGEDNPYAEGLIIDANGGKHYDVDAHYEARVMTFKKQTITDLKKNNSGYILSIKTPFGETRETVNVKEDGVYSMSGMKLCDLNNVSSIFTNEADYQWMKFVKNTTANRIGDSNIAKNTCKYPGDNSPSCLNVFQLLAELYKEVTYTENGGEEVYYTCFIDENYYRGKLWTAYVNKDPRTMLIANDLDVSADKKSLYAKVAYSISQRSISTFYTTDYKPDGTNLVKAFGTEIIDEEKDYHSRLTTNSVQISSPHDWNAWTSAVNTNITKHSGNASWYSETNSVEGIQPLYSTVAKACMSRNRDANGDGKIGEGEVKWYLAAVDQYRALFFGQEVLNQDAYLIKRSELVDINDEYLRTNWYGDDKGHDYRGQYHYFSCSGGDKTSFWPEEGLTNNPINQSGWVSRAELVRCIRTLHSGEDGLSDPEPYYTYTNNTFNLGGIKATRTYTESPLPRHNEIEPQNNLYSSFVVAQHDLISDEKAWGDNKYNFDLAEITGNETDFCSRYNKQSDVVGTNEANYSWRTPNQKEFALMVSKLPDNRYGTRSRFSGDDLANDYWDWHNTPGFWSDSGGGGRINVGTGYEGGVRIRCVRDNK